MKPLLPLAVLLVAAVAGCLAKPAPPAPPLPLLERTAANVPALAYDAEAGVTWWSDFVQTYPLRNAMLPNDGAARDHISAGLAAAGYHVHVYQYPVGAQGQTAPATAGPAYVSVVEATKPGTDPHAGTLALGAHYDDVYPGLGLTAGTVQAAYDDGAGTANTYNLCVALAKVPTRHALTCLFFDGEELGVVGSKAYVADNRSHPTPDLFIGFDMTGLNWPGVDVTQAGKQTWKLYAWMGPEFADALYPFVNGTLHKVLGYPDAGAQAFPLNKRNSDEFSFAQAHIPTIRFSGGLAAGDYPQYHQPGDTVDYVEQFAGGRDRLSAGMAAVVRTAWQLTLELDQTSLAELKATYAS